MYVNRADFSYQAWMFRAFAEIASRAQAVRCTSVPPVRKKW